MRTQDACAAKQRFDCCVRAGERGGVRARGARSCARGAGLQREDGLSPRKAPGDTRELLRVPERLEIEKHDVGGVILLPPLEQVVRGDVRLVADRDEGREAEAALGRLLEQREPERAALRRERDATRRQRARRERGVQAEDGHGDAEAVRADEPRSVRSHEREQLLLALGAFGADLGESRGDHAQRLDALPQCLLCRLEHAAAGHADDCEVDWIGDLLDRRVRAHACDGLAVAVDGVRGAGEVRSEDVAEELTADRAAALRRADDGDGGRSEERPERRGDRDVVALLDPGAEVLRRGDREAHLDLAAAERARHLEARVAEDCEHRRVLGEHLGDELLDTDLGRSDGELLEQSRRSAAALKLVRDRECDLCGRGIAQARVLRDRDDVLGSLFVGQRANQGAAVDPVGIEDMLDELCVDMAHPVEPEVAAVGREQLEERDEGACIVVRRRPESKCRAVAEDHVDRDGGHRVARRRRQVPPCGPASRRPARRS